jgi:hypothetical protein
LVWILFKIAGFDPPPPPPHPAPYPNSAFLLQSLQLQNELCESESHVLLQYYTFAGFTLQLIQFAVALASDLTGKVRFPIVPSNVHLEDSDRTVHPPFKRLGSVSADASHLQVVTPWEN